MDNHYIASVLKPQLLAVGLDTSYITRFTNALSPVGLQSLCDEHTASPKQPNTLLLDLLIVYFSRSGFVSTWIPILCYAQSHDHNFRLNKARVQDCLAFFEPPEDPRTTDVWLKQYFEHLCHPMVTLVLGGAARRTTPLTMRRGSMTESSLAIEDLADGQSITGSYFEPLIYPISNRVKTRCWHIATRYQDVFRLLHLHIVIAADGVLEPSSEHNKQPAIVLSEEVGSARSHWPYEAEVGLTVSSEDSGAIIYQKDILPNFDDDGFVSFALTADAVAISNLRKQLLAERHLSFMLAIGNETALHFDFCGPSTARPS